MMLVCRDSIIDPHQQIFDSKTLICGCFSPDLTDDKADESHRLSHSRLSSSAMLYVGPAMQGDSMVIREQCIGSN